MKKITVTLDEDELARIRGLVESGKVPSVSGFVQHAVRVSLDDVALDRNDRQVIVLLARAAEAGARVTVPASALA